MEKRRYLSNTEKARIIDRQKGVCACGCKEPLKLGHIHFDHRKPLAISGTNDVSNFDALIDRHHIVKTADEATWRAKADRAGAKHRGEHLNARDRELSKRLERTRQVGT